LRDETAFFAGDVMRHPDTGLSDGVGFNLLCLNGRRAKIAHVSLQFAADNDTLVFSSPLPESLTKSYGD
jgi:hypothetical protein